MPVVLGRLPVSVETREGLQTGAVTCPLTNFRGRVVGHRGDLGFQTLQNRFVQQRIARQRRRWVRIVHLYRSPNVHSPIGIKNFKIFDLPLDLN